MRSTLLLLLLLVISTYAWSTSGAVRHCRSTAATGSAVCMMAEESKIKGSSMRTDSSSLTVTEEQVRCIAFACECESAL